MTTLAHTPADQKTASLARPHPLLSVMSWELRRLLAIRLLWVAPILLFGLFVADFWPARNPLGYGPFAFDDHVAGTSALGLVDLLSERLFLLLVLLLPFVSADGVARDWKRRTHELVMTTTLPGWAYIWGRYLVVLLLSLGLALVLLATLLVLGFVMPLYNPVIFLPPQIGSIVTLWAVVIVPATILVSSLCFAIGAWLPHHSNLVKIGVLLIWLAIAGVFAVLPDNRTTITPPWYLFLDPTSNGRSVVAINQFRSIPTPASNDQALSLLHTLEQTLPDLGAWIASQLLWVGLALALVALAALTFKRFRNVAN
jgi:hypothetical protein